MMKYYKLFILMDKKGMIKMELLKVISSATLTKLGKGESVTTDILCKLCAFLNCQPGDIMEYFPNNDGGE
ncbi:MAG: helix-turn-helix domain-containing protein [Clostridium sp.]|nr:helix-turn-helix domain-containing protein [Clostridium sp.]